MAKKPASNLPPLSAKVRRNEDSYLFRRNDCAAGINGLRDKDASGLQAGALSGRSSEGVSAPEWNSQRVHLSKI
jgi:hypothetical protein